MVAAPAEDSPSVRPEDTLLMVGMSTSLIVTVTTPPPSVDINHSLPASSMIRASTVKGVPTSSQSTETVDAQFPPALLISVVRS